jgi:hypothetical protein
MTRKRPGKNISHQASAKAPFAEAWESNPPHEAVSGGTPDSLSPRELAKFNLSPGKLAKIREQAGT